MWCSFLYCLVQKGPKSIENSQSLFCLLERPTCIIRFTARNTKSPRLPLFFYFDTFLFYVFSNLNKNWFKVWTPDEVFVFGLFSYTQKGHRLFGAGIIAPTKRARRERERERDINLSCCILFSDVKRRKVCRRSVEQPLEPPQSAGVHVPLIQQPRCENPAPQHTGGVFFLNNRQKIEF